MGGGVVDVASEAEEAGVWGERKRYENSLVCVE
jgi:hypothetical protein